MTPLHVEVLVEEPSAEETLQILLPRLFVGPRSFRIHAYQGKSDLLNKLGPTLRAYRTWIPDDWRIVVLVDEDRQDCISLKSKLEGAAKAAGFATKSTRDRNGGFVVLNRLAIEELEAWFLGDVPALIEAFPRLPETLGNKAKFRDPDAGTGGTSEALERELKMAGYYKGGFLKKDAARRVAPHMDPDRNRSKSFQVFRDGVRALRD